MLYSSISKLLLLKVVHTVGFCVKMGGTLCCLDPKAIEKVSHKALTLFPPLFCSCKQLQWFFQTKRNPSNKQTDRQTQATQNKPYLFHRIKQFRHSILFPYTDKDCAMTLSPKNFYLFLLLTPQMNAILRNWSHLDFFSTPLFKIAQFTCFTVRETFRTCITQRLIQGTQIVVPNLKFILLKKKCKMLNDCGFFPSFDLQSFPQN